MLNRRLIYLVILAFAGCLWYLGRNGFGATMLGPVLILLAFFIGIPALIGAFFNLQLLGAPQKKRGFGLLSNRQGQAFGAGVVFLFGILVMVIAIKGVFAGKIPSITLGADIHFATAPLYFIFSWIVWVAGGLGLVWLSRKVFLSDK